MLKKKEKKQEKHKIHRRKNDSHKGQNGRVLAVGGSEDYVGAIALTGLAALRAGSDIVIIAAPEKTAWAINKMSPDLITKKLPGKHLKKEHVNTIMKSAKKSDTIIIGNGMGTRKESKEAANKILKELNKMMIPAVVDADAIKIAKIKNLNNTIITPHAKELEEFLKNNKKEALISRLKKRTSNEERINMIREELKDFFERDNVLLLKGKEDLIISKNKSLIIKGGNAGMTVGGTGDILAGLCGGYLAQTADLFLSASLASMNCKKIGDKLLKRSNFGFGYIASDFLKEIKKLRKIKKQKVRKQNVKKQKRSKKKRDEK